MPCPWYRNGMCTSPKIGKPTTAVVSVERCLGPEAEYKACEYFVDEKGHARKGIDSFTLTAAAQQYRPYPPIHVVYNRPDSKCPFIKVIDQGGGFIVYCNVLGRLLTRSEIKLCERYWRTCPIMKVGEGYVTAST